MTHKITPHRLRNTLSVAAVALLAYAGGAAAQEFPTKSMRFIVPVAPGSASDTLARLIGPKMTETLGQQVIVENRSGAGTIVGTSVVARSPADGYTLLMTSVSHAINTTLYSKLPFDPIKDFAGVTPVALIPNVLIVHPALPVKTVQDLIALAKAKPGALNYVSAGVGSAAHLSAELFRGTAGVNIVHVPFKGFSEAMIEMLAGRAEMQFSPLIIAGRHIAAGKVRALAVTTTKRSAVLPHLPTMAEAGVKDYAFDPWWGVLAPAGTPKPVIDKLNSTVIKILQTPDLTKQLQSQGADPYTMSPDEFDRFLRSEVVKLAKLVKDSGAKAE